VEDAVARPSDETLHSGKIPTNLPRGWEFGKVFGGDGPETEPDLPAPAQLFQPISFEGATMQDIVLPRTATPMMLKLLAGGTLLALALATLTLAVRRRARP
jgi:Ca-activated chloride channel family protein